MNFPAQLFPHSTVTPEIMRKLLVAGAAVAALSRQAKPVPPVEEEQVPGG